MQAGSVGLTRLCVCPSCTQQHVSTRAHSLSSTHALSYHAPAPSRVLVGLATEVLVVVDDNAQGCCCVRIACRQACMSW